MKYISITILLITFFCCHSQKGMDDSLTPIANYDYCNEGWDKYTQLASNEDTLVYFRDCPFYGKYVFTNKYDYSGPWFNPNNPNQIAYVRHENNAFPYKKAEVCFFDICSGEQRVLTEIPRQGIEWSKKNWLLFTKKSMLYKVKPNGDSLTQLTFNRSYNYNASWNEKGDQFVYRKTVGPLRYCIIANENGINQDTIEALMHHSNFSWIRNSSIISPMNIYEAKSGVGIYDIQLQTKTQVDTLKDQNMTKDIDYIEDNIIWLITGLGHNKRWAINKTNIHTKERTEITRGFFNRQYLSLDISGDESKIIVQRRDLSQISNCEIAESNSIYIMDIDGTNERKINIPE